MDNPRDIKDRIAKRLLRHPRMMRDLLNGYVPAPWLAGVDVDTIRELPTELISPKGDRRVGDLLWLADRADGGRLLLMVEHQTTPGRRMAARMTTQTGLLYESLGHGLRGADRRFPALLPVVVYAGDRHWGEADDLSATVEASPVPVGVRGLRYLLLDLARIASEHGDQSNRFRLLARLTFASSPSEAARLLTESRDWLDLADEDEQRLFEDLVAWAFALVPSQGPTVGWDLDRRSDLEELMGRLTTLETNERRRMARVRREMREAREQATEQGIEQGVRQGIEQGVARQRAMLVRQAVRRFGADTGRRLDGRLQSVSDPIVLEELSDLIIDCSTGEQLLDRIPGGSDLGRPTSENGVVR